MISKATGIKKLLVLTVFLKKMVKNRIYIIAIKANDNFYAKMVQTSFFLRFLSENGVLEFICSRYIYAANVLLKPLVVFLNPLF